MAATTGSGEIELLAVDGVTWLPLMLAPNLDQRGQPQPKTFQEALAASDADTPVSQWLEATVTEAWPSGLGIDYDAALCLDTWSSPGKILPAGAPTHVSLPASGDSASPIVAIAEYTDGSLFVAQRGTAGIAGRVLRSSDGTGQGAGTFVDTGLGLAPGEYVRDLLVADDGFGRAVMWATSSSVTGASGRMHKWPGTGATPWDSTAAPSAVYPYPGTFGTWGRNRIVKVMWEDQEGISDWRLVVVASHQGQISYTRPGGDPMLAAGWVEGIGQSTPAPEAELAAARRHVYLNTLQDVYDLNEQGDLTSLTSYTLLQRGNSLCCFFLDGFVYRAFADGLDRVWVGEPGTLQSTPGICSPGWRTTAESGWGAGYVTALHQHQGFLLAAIYNVGLNKAAVFRGKDRAIEGIETPNPLAWYGPEAVCSEPAIVSRMHVASAYAAPYQTKLWLATWNVSQADTPRLDYVSLPIGAGGAYGEIASGGPHRYATGEPDATSHWQPSCSLSTINNSYDDKAAVKYPYQVAIGSLGLDDPPGTKLDVYTRADPYPGSIVWGDALPVTESPSQTVTPSVTAGHRLQGRIDFFSPDGEASPPKPAILDAIRTTYWRAAPSLNSWTLEVEYGAGTVDLAGTDQVHSGRSVQWMTDRLIELCNGGPTTMRDREDGLWIVKLRQVLPRESTVHDAEYGRTTKASITLAVLREA